MQDDAGLGRLLRECRQARGLSIDDLSRATRIVPHLLQALEEECFDDLSAPVFVRGFIRAYCRCVGESPEQALALYEAYVRDADAAARAAAAPAAHPRLGRVVSLTGGLRERKLPRLSKLSARPLIAGGLLLVLGGVLYLLAPSVDTWSTAASRPGAPQPHSTAPAPAPPPGGPEAVAPEPEPVAPSPASHVLVMRANETTWVRVRPEEGAASQELLQPGSVREWRSTGRFTVTVGNAGGVSLELDGMALPRLGNHGEVVRDLTISGEPSR
ncbi:MAG: helix-turn-helix domain-containing protein [Candidatus Rokubacteria bacterium]|nr:helix-turn-helix domain-containing protein [Candidatus Rokubacteria bacterium]